MIQDRIYVISVKNARFRLENAEILLKIILSILGQHCFTAISYGVFAV